MGDNITRAVQTKYASVAKSGLSTDHSGVRAVAEAFGYTPEQLASIPAEANMGLSCGNPTAFASLRLGETVVDLGCGGGLDVFLAAAKVGPTGKAIGIDIWSAKDLSGNAIERTRANIEMEGVGGRVELRTEDACRMTFPDASFDVVLSNLCIHNIPTGAGRDRACREIARVLRPGGLPVISDYKLTRNYAAVFAGEGLSVEWRGPFWRGTFPPLKVFVARKPL